MEIKWEAEYRPDPDYDRWYPCRLLQFIGTEGRTCAVISNRRGEIKTVPSWDIRIASFTEEEDEDQ